MVARCDIVICRPTDPSVTPLCCTGVPVCPKNTCTAEALHTPSVNQSVYRGHGVVVTGGHDFSHLPHRKGLMMKSTVHMKVENGMRTRQEHGLGLSLKNVLLVYIILVEYFGAITAAIH